MTIQGSFFSNCASAAIGGSVAILNVLTVQITGCTFTDSLVNVVNASQLVNPSFQAEKDASLFFSTGGGIGYGGAVFVAPRYASGVSMSISGCVFLRCQVLATLNNYDFLDSIFLNLTYPRDPDRYEGGAFLQGGAFAAGLPLHNKSSAADPGYMLSIAQTSFTQCMVLFSSNRLSRVQYDVTTGGAISVFDTVPPNLPLDFSTFILPPSRVVLQDLTFSGEPKRVSV